MTERQQYILPNDTGVCVLECDAAFKSLTDKEKLYSHYLSRASWYGGLAVLIQTSPESPALFVLLQKIFKSQKLPELEAAAKDAGLTDSEYQAILVYAAGVYSNMGNYKSFGDTKIIPDVSRESFECFIKSSTAYKTNQTEILNLWNEIAEHVFSLDERQKQLGLGKKGITTYFSSNCDHHDADLIQEFLNAKDLSAYNTRLFKTVDEIGNITYEIRLAAAETSDEKVDSMREVPQIGTHQFTGKEQNKPVTINVVRGDYAPLMTKLVENLKLAQEYAANDAERNMLQYYVESFTVGSIPAHKDGSRHWIKDKGPIVESYIGFIESYRDPVRTRGEFEGFVAIVNKEMSAKFADLVNDAEHLLLHLPWPRTYEKDTFLRPDFTSLEVLTFSGSGIPAGINIPNYDDIRQLEGFKNVSLGNVLSAGYKDTKITFLGEADKELFAKYKAPSFEVQVGLHELLGHGSGKLFMKEADGTFNFDIDSVKHTETGEKVTSWYEPGESYYSKFSTISSSYEECRAECVGLYLCLLSEVLRIFGHDGDQADHIIYINWLNMVRAGLLALEFYSPQTRTWGQAHMQARHVILRVLMEADDELVTIEKRLADDEQPDLVIKLDRSKIISVGKPAIAKFLQRIQTYKSTADYKSAKEMYDHYSVIHEDEEPHFLSLRTIVLHRKQPRKMFVQCNTTANDGKVELKNNYEATVTGLIQSFIERFPDDDMERCLIDLWKKDTAHYNY